MLPALPVGQAVDQVTGRVQGKRTPNERDDIRAMAVGYSFEEGARQALCSCTASCGRRLCSVS
jgi:hypothetical protein